MSFYEFQERENESKERKKVHYSNGRKKERKSETKRLDNQLKGHYREERWDGTNECRLTS